MSKKQTVVVTGGAKGIGLCICQNLCQEKFHVVLFDRDRESGVRAERYLSEYGTAEFLHCDVSQASEIDSAVRTIRDRQHDVHGLVNNAGIMIQKPMEALTLEEWKQVLDVNLTGYFLMARALLDELRIHKGAVVNISSTRAFMSEKNTEAYAASKGGVVALTHAMAVSLGPDLRVNCISPGWIEVSNWRLGEERVEDPHHSEVDRMQHPAGRVGEPQDVADLVLFLLSEKAKFITGSNFFVDGGMTRKMIYA